MNKKELYDYMVEGNIIETQREKEMTLNILDKAEGMEEMEQYNYLCDMLIGVPERILRNVYY